MYLLMSKLIFQSKHRHNGILNFEVPVRVSNLERGGLFIFPREN